MDLDEFRGKIEEFVYEYFRCSGCRFCHENGNELETDNYNGSYDKAIRELYKDFIGERGE